MKIHYLFPLLVLAGLCACEKPDPDPTPNKEEEQKEETVDVYEKWGLKDLGASNGVTVGAAFTYGEYNQDAALKTVLAHDFAVVTFGNEMKHDAIVQASGTYRFNTADAMVRYATDAGARVFGHNLGWHSQQQAPYLNGLIQTAAPNNAKSLFQDNWNFESGLKGYDADEVSATTHSYAVFVGEQSARVDSDGGSLTTPAIAVEAGQSYTVSVWVKATDKGTEFSIGTAFADGTSASEKATADASWQQFSTTVEADGASLRVTLSGAKGISFDNLRVCGKTDGGTDTPQEYINAGTIVTDGSFEAVGEGGYASTIAAKLGWGGNGQDKMSVVGDVANGGTHSLKMDNSAAATENSWDIQAITCGYPVQTGKTYRIAWYARSSSATYDMQIDIRENGEAKAYRSSAYGNWASMNDSEWTYQYTDYTVEAGTDLAVAFYGGGETANVIWIDDFQIFPLDAAPSARDKRPAAITSSRKTDGEMAFDRIQYVYKDWVYAMVEHFDVYGWDVINETFTEQGAFRNGSNTQSGNHIFLWGDYFTGGGKAFVDKAFRYTREALEHYGKTAELYINEYNLEISPAKLDAICDYAKNNPDVDGIGSQMHISADVNKQGIVNMLNKMVATGKKVRISELDITKGKTNQAEMYVYVFEQYLKLVPEEQRGGITIWGISDANSWLGAEKEPLLFNASYQRKEAYNRLHLFLRTQAGLK